MNENHGSFLFQAIASAWVQLLLGHQIIMGRGLKKYRKRKKLKIKKNIDVGRRLLLLFTNHYS